MYISNRFGASAAERHGLAPSHRVVSIPQIQSNWSEHARGDNPAHFSKHSEYTILFILLPFPGFGNICNATIKLIGMTGSDHLLSTCTTEKRTECNTFANTKNVQKGPTLTRIQKKWFGKFH